jgi:hypothetical protein
MRALRRDVAPRRAPRIPLIEVHVDLPYHWRACGEYIWARPLGDDLYELQNVPFLAYGLNHHDVVKATAEAPGLAPEIRRVVVPSGHRTVRIFFARRLSRGRRLGLLQRLVRLSVGYEKNPAGYFALDVTCEADIFEVLERLDEWQRRGWCEYETGEPRVPGSFDDRPAEQVH